MNVSETRPAPAYLTEVVNQVRAAYPGGVPADEYRPLVYVLCEALSQRNAATVIEACGVKDYYPAYNDILGIAYRHAEYAAAAKPVLEKLIRHGFDPNAE